MHPSSDSIYVEDLRRRLTQRRVIVVLGAGVSLAATRGAQVASWKGLLLDGIQRCRTVRPDLSNQWSDVRNQQIELNELVSAAEEIERILSTTGGEYGRWLRETVGQLHENDLDHRLINTIARLGTPIATTNYDSILEKALGRPPFTWQDVNQIDRWINGDDNDNGIVHLHGSWANPRSVILGIRSYDAIVRDPHTRAILQAMWTAHTLLFIGFGDGLDDPNFTALLEWAQTAHGSSEYRHYRLTLANQVGTVGNQRIVAIPFGEQLHDLPGFIEGLPLPMTTAAVANIFTATNAPTATAPIFSVPFEPKADRVVGRDRALRAVRKALDAEVTPNGRIAAVVGIGGLGKTQTAVEYCHAVREEYADGVIWIDCARNIDGQLIALSEANGWVHPDANTTDKLAVATYRMSLLHQILVVLDDVANFEDVERRFFSRRTASRHYLITSRNPIPGVAPVDTIQITLDPLEAVELLRIESRRPNILVNDTDALALVTLFDFLPLAIEIAGAYLKQRPTITLSMYRDSIYARGLGAPGMTPSHLSSFTAHAPRLREAVEISDMIAADEPLLPPVLECFGITRGTSIGRSLLAAMVGRDEQDLEFNAALDRASVLRIVTPESQAVGERWRMHRLVWQVFHDKSSAAVDAAGRVAVAERVARWFRTRHEEVSQLGEFEAESEQIRFWRERMRDDGQNTIAARLCWLEAYLWFHRGRQVEARTLLEEGLQLLPVGAEGDSELRVHLLADSSVMAADHDAKDALTKAFDAAALARSLQPSAADVRAHALITLSYAERRLGAINEARSSIREAIKLAMPFRRYFQAREHLARLERDAGNFDQVIGILDDLSKLPAAGVPEYQARIAFELSVTYQVMGQQAASLKQCELALKITTSLYGQTHSQSIRLMALVAGLRSFIDPPNALLEAEEAFNMSLSLYGEDSFSTLQCHCAMGDVLHAMRNYPAAAAHKERFVDLVTRKRGVTDPETEDAIDSLAWTYLHMNRANDARLLYEESLHRLEEHVGPSNYRTCDRAIGLSKAYWSLGDRLRAYKVLQQQMGKLEGLPRDNIAVRTVEAELRKMRSSGHVPGVRATGKKKKPTR